MWMMLVCTVHMNENNEPAAWLIKKFLQQNLQYMGHTVGIHSN